MNDSLKTLPRLSAGTLADLVLAFGPGSSCFCCGSTLHDPDAGILMPAAPFGERLLRCLACGAEVLEEGACESSLAPSNGMPVRQRALAAA